jgi:hypothetical protein
MPLLVWWGPNAIANKGGLKFTLETQAAAMKFAFPSTTDPTNTIGIGYKKAAPLSILILFIACLSLLFG